MTKNRNRRKEVAVPSPFEEARDEMFQHVIRCGVLQAAPEHQVEWFDDTMAYLAERYPELSEGQITELRTLGLRFCEPPKTKVAGGANTASAA
ncbi:MAG TPA: hypothetical protein VJ803_00975 [Gemmatimonadaceae bacterium]|jgi:hypothetical protein|nr:hypothetical protein [Gemmatimonadaceae bacterium]